jgi:hypothetical protein
VLFVQGDRSYPNVACHRRKKRWKEEATTTRPTDSFTTIAHVLKSDKRVDKFRVCARVVGTFPLQLEDCVIRCCKGCSEQFRLFACIAVELMLIYGHRLPSGTDTCMLCITSDGTTPEWEDVFHLFLRLQDKHGTAQITVAVDQNVCPLFQVCIYFAHPREQSSMLGGLSLDDDVMARSGMTEMVRERLSGFIGNLEAVQAANSQGRTLEAKVPVREYTIESWYVEGEKDESNGEPVVAYGLL